MKRILSVVLAFALAGTLLSGCNRDQNRPAGGGSTAAPSGSSGTSGSSTTGKQDQQKPKQPSPSTPSGGSGSGGTK